MERLLKELNLSQEQLLQLKKLKDGHPRDQEEQSNRERRDVQKTAKAELAALLHGEASDEQVLAKLAELQAANQAMRNDQFRKLLELRSVMTLEQRKNFRPFDGPPARPGMHGTNDGKVPPPREED